MSGRDAAILLLGCLLLGCSGRSVGGVQAGGGGAAGGGGGVSPSGHGGTGGRVSTGGTPLVGGGGATSCAADDPIVAVRLYNRVQLTGGLLDELDEITRGPSGGYHRLDGSPVADQIMSELATVTCPSSLELATTGLQDCVRVSDYFSTYKIELHYAQREPVWLLSEANCHEYMPWNILRGGDLLRYRSDGGLAAALGPLLVDLPWNYGPPEPGDIVEGAVPPEIENGFRGFIELGAVAVLAVAKSTAGPYLRLDFENGRGVPITVHAAWAELDGGPPIHCRPCQTGACLVDGQWAPGAPSFDLTPFDGFEVWCFPANGDALAGTVVRGRVQVEYLVEQLTYTSPGSFTTAWQ